MPVEITPIPVAEPVVIPAIPEEVLDTAFLKQMIIVRNQDNTFDIEVMWQYGKVEDGVSALKGKVAHDRFVNVLSDEFVAENPEVLQAVGPLLSGLVAASKRKGSI